MSVPLFAQQQAVATQKQNDRKAGMRASSTPVTSSHRRGIASSKGRKSNSSPHWGGTCNLFGSFHTRLSSVSSLSTLIAVASGISCTASAA